MITLHSIDTACECARSLFKVCVDIMSGCPTHLDTKDTRLHAVIYRHYDSVISPSYVDNDLCMLLVSRASYPSQFNT